MRPALMACLACLCLLAAVPAAGATQPSAIAGVASHPWRLGPDTTPLPFWPLRDPSAREQIFGAIQAMGVKQVRVDLRWERVEPLIKGVRDWSEFDGIHDSAVAHGITLLPMVAMPPSWANSGRGPWSFPDNPKDFEDFLAAAIARYPDIPAWEIWNEPNVPNFSQPTVDPAKFVELLAAAHRAKEREGSSAAIVSGGLLWIGLADTKQFFERMVDLHAFDYVDGFAIHPYSAMAPDQPGSAFLELPYFHDRLEQIGKPNMGIWVTEYGAPTSTSSSEYAVSLTPAGQADRLRQAYALAARWPWVKNLTWYEFQDLCVDPADVTCNFGLVHQDMSPKPAAGALKDIVTQGDLPKLESRVSLWRGPSRLRHTSRGLRRQVTLSGKLDLLGAEQVTGPVTLTLTWSPDRRGRAAKTHALRLGADGGSFSTVLRNPRPGMWRAVATYAGNADYDRDTSRTLSLYIKPPPRR